VNNGLGVVLAVTSTEEGEVSVAVAFAGALLTVGIAAFGLWLSRRSGPVGP
jgi:hypothetical protein